MKRQPTRLRLNRESIRFLTALDLAAAGGLAVSNPVLSCDSCTGCGCKPPG
jgi:hypothetical protein